MPSINHIAYNAASEEIILGATLGAHLPVYETKLPAPPDYRAALMAGACRSIAGAGARINSARATYDTRRMVVVA